MGLSRDLDHSITGARVGDEVRLVDGGEADRVLPTIPVRCSLISSNGPT